MCKHRTLAPLALLIIVFAQLFLTRAATADVVKPALIEIVAHTDGRLSIEIRASIEALLTGINGAYRNTRDSPNAQAYDDLRVLEPRPLQTTFASFIPTFLDRIRLEADGHEVALSLQSVDIPEPGYTKVPRISLIRLSGTISPYSGRLQWYYPADFGDSAVRVKQVDSGEQQWHWSAWQWIRTDTASEPFTLDQLFQRKPWWQTGLNYVEIGYTHILPKGTDHILFVLGLILFSTRLRPLLWQITMFTLAHTLTLGLSMYGLVTLPSRWVEPLIALSIAYVGLENTLMQTMHRWRLVLVFAFGLLHGLGFAGALKDFGMPAEDYALALISFNVGVELGQLTIVLAIVALVALFFRNRMSLYRRMIVIPASLIISLIGLYWAIDRLNLPG